MKVILASGSPRRKELLGQILKDFEILPAKGEEIITKTEPFEIVEELSVKKAEEVFEILALKEEYENEDFLVIGSDTVVAYQGEIMGKPKDEADAFRMIHAFQGKTHQVYTGVTFLWKKRGQMGRKTFHEVTDVVVYPMDEEEIMAYIATGEPMDKAGAYGIQGRFAPFVRKIDGEYNTVVGLPIGRVNQELKGILNA